MSVITRNILLYDVVPREDLSEFPPHDDATYDIAVQENDVFKMLVAVYENYMENCADGMQLHEIADELRKDVLELGRRVGRLGHTLDRSTHCLSCMAQCAGDTTCPLAFEEVNRT